MNDKRLLEGVLGLPPGALDSNAGDAQGKPGDFDEVFDFVVDLSANLWQNMSEEHRKKSATCSENLLRAIELERLRTRARILGVDVSQEPPREINPEEFDKIAEDIRTRIDELDRKLNGVDNGGGTS